MARSPSRAFTGSFLARVTDNQNVMRDAHVPIHTCASLEDAWNWLDAHGMDSLPCRACMSDAD